MLTAIVGINWGDEGKGRMVDLLSSDYDIICRYQGGNNAGHTVVNDRGKFILNLLPSGILRETTVNIMGNGMVIDIEHLVNEAGKLREQGIKITPDNLKISDKAIICLPYHRLMDIMEEDRLADKKFGSTRRGIAPVYADKYMKKALRMEDLLDMDSLYEKVKDIVEWKNITVKGYGHEPVDADEIMDWLRKYGKEVAPYITDVSEYLYQAAAEGTTSPEQAALLQDKGFAWAFALRCLPREVERNLWSQAEFDSVTAKKLCELRERFWPDTVQLTPERMAVVLGDLYSSGATIVSSAHGYGIYFRKEDTLYFVELQADNDRAAEVLMEAAREKEVIVEKAVITVGASQPLFLGEGTRQDYGMIRFDAEPFDVAESYMRLMLEN